MPKETRSTLTRKVDKWFSQYIRLRDTDDNGYGPCVTCGKTVFWKKADAGHFRTRAHLVTRWDERNVNLQCKYCNGPRAGMQYEHGCRIDQLYGDGTARKLSDLSVGLARFGMNDLRVMARTYQTRTRELLDAKQME